MSGPAFPVLPVRTVQAADIRAIGACALLCAVAICSLTGAAFAGPPAQAYPILPKHWDNTNPGFEEGAGDTVPGWQSVSVDGPKWLLSETKAHQGKRSMMLQGTGVDKEVWLVSEPLRAGPGDCVDFLSWVHADGTPQHVVTVWVEARVANQWQVIEPPARGPEMRADYFVNDWDWMPRGHVVVAPLGTDGIRLVAACSAGNPAEAVWYVDDFSCRIASFSAYCSGRANTERLPDIAWAIADALSWNYVGCYGAKNAHTPNIDHLAAEGRMYRKATTAGTWTRPSFASMFTSLYASQHTAELVNSPLPESWITLAECLKERGYFTAAFMWSPYDGFVGPAMGYNQGFDVFAYSTDANQVFETAKEFLDHNAAALSKMNGGGLFLLWHFGETHGDYRNWFPEIITNRGRMGNITMSNALIDDAVKAHDPNRFNEGDMEYARACYASDVMTLDTRLGELLGRLKFLGNYEKLNIIVCADHGESFGEKPDIWNHANPYITCCGIPLIVRFPGRMAPTMMAGEPLVSSLDIMPTLLALAGTPIPAQCEGRDLLGSAGGLTTQYGITEGKSVGVFDGGSFALRDARYKLVAPDAARRTDPNDWSSAQWIMFDRGSPSRFELYDLESDPFELKDIAQEQPEVLKRLKEAAKAHAEHTGMLNPSPAKAPQATLTEETKDYLESQGYLPAKRK